MSVWMGGCIDGRYGGKWYHQGTLHCHPILAQWGLKQKPFFIYLLTFLSLTKLSAP